MISRMLRWATYISFLISIVAAAPEYDSHPIAQYRPAFARSLPVQILLTGIILTLVAVLFIHLMFTAQYHWPLAPVNYVLQLSGVTTLLISLIATIHVVLSATLTQAGEWPFMLDYIAIDVPPPLDTEFHKKWTTAERATWLVMNASTSGLIQITHIQFLTLLYPSRLEGRLIFALLGPLAVVAAVMQLVPIHQGDNIEDITIIASAVRNVCNATLSLLFTVALFIWGLLVNRKQAWRTDGGTAAFGAGALALAVVSTALNFLFVNKEDEYVWLPGLMWAVVLWQSFLGWWWWVGAGAGSNLLGEDELKEKRRRESRRRERERRKEDRAKVVKSQGVWRGMSRVFNSARSRPSARPDGSRDMPEPPSPTHSITPSIASTTSATSAVTLTTLPSALPRFLHDWYAFIRREHVAATRQQTAERIQRIRELERQRPRAPRAQQTGAIGWGLGSFGFSLGHTPVSPPISPREREPSSSEGTNVSRHSPRRSRSLSLSMLGRKAQRKEYTDDIELEDRGEGPSRLRGEQEASGGSGSRPSRYRRRDTSPSEDILSNDEDTTGPWSEPMTTSSQSQSGNRGSRRGTLQITVPQSPPRVRRTEREEENGRERATGRSMFWWGPLAKWRLRDSTTYS